MPRIMPAIRDGANCSVDAFVTAVSSGYHRVDPPTARLLFVVSRVRTNIIRSRALGSRRTASAPREFDVVSARLRPFPERADNFQDFCGGGLAPEHNDFGPASVPARVCSDSDARLRGSGCPLVVVPETRVRQGCDPSGPGQLAISYKTQASPEKLRIRVLSVTIGSDLARPIRRALF